MNLFRSTLLSGDVWFPFISEQLLVNGGIMINRRLAQPPSSVSLKGLHAKFPCESFHLFSFSHSTINHLRTRERKATIACGLPFDVTVGDEDAEIKANCEKLNRVFERTWKWLHNGECERIPI